MKKLGLAVLIAAALVVAAAGALYGWASSEYTVCYGMFESRAAADRAADAGREADLDPDVDHRPTESAVEFQTGETGGDAREARGAFHEIVRREGGTLGHPGDGCLERGFFDH